MNLLLIKNRIAFLLMSEEAFFVGFCGWNDGLVCCRVVYHGEGDKNVAKSQEKSHTKDFYIHYHFFAD